MRRGTTYRCSTCGESSFYGDTCPRCNTAMVDERGNSPPDLQLEAQIVRITTRLPTGADLVEDPIGSLLWTTIGSVTSRVQWRWLARARRRWLRHQAESIPLATADSLSAVRVRLRGRVHLIDPVPSLSAEEPSPQAAFLLDQAVHTNGTDALVIRRRWRCGRFLVVDDTGAALVDDDFFLVLPLDAMPLRSPWRIEAKHGAVVEVTGTVATQSAAGLPPQLLTAAGAGYRGTGQVPVFVGRSNDPLILRLLGPT